MGQLGPEGRGLSRAESAARQHGQIGKRKDFSSTVEFLSMRRVINLYEKQFIEKHRRGVRRYQSDPDRRYRGRFG